MSLNQLSTTLEELGWIVTRSERQIVCGLEEVEIEGTPFSVLQGLTFSVRFEEGTWFVRLFERHPEPQPLVNELSDVTDVLELIRTYREAHQS